MKFLLKLNTLKSETKVMAKLTMILSEVS